MQLERKVYKLELQDAHDDDGPNFKGIASVMNIKDLHGDVIDSGAFTRTLNHKNGRFVLLEAHMSDQRLGVAVLEEKDPKILVDGFMNLEKQMAKDTLSDMKFQKAHKVPMGLSIGFNTEKQDFIDGVRHIKELSLWELSVVTFPANPKAKVTVTKAAIPFQDLPLAAKDTAWDVKAAYARVKEWAPEYEYKNAFVWFDDVKLQIADIVDGKLMAVPRGIIAASAIVQRGSVLPAEGAQVVHDHLGRYYEKMGVTPVLDHDALDFTGVMCYAASLKEAGIKLDDGDKALIEKAVGRFSALFPNGNGMGTARKHVSIYDGADAERLSEEADQAAIDAQALFIRNLRTEV